MFSLRTFSPPHLNCLTSHHFIINYSKTLKQFPLGLVYCAYMYVCAYSNKSRAVLLLREIVTLAHFFPPYSEQQSYKIQSKFLRQTTKLLN